MKAPPITKDVAGRIADRLTVLLGLAALLQGGAFGSVSGRQKDALQELLETSEELKILLRPLFSEPDSTHS
ncbi:MAG TPA: hypothetical protein VKU80_08095 [Planctomycetota bacterium]|nr:hypothetical protein [Planctomycetota bacterium]